MHRLRAPILALAATAALACTQKPSGGNDAGSGLDTAIRCATDAECLFEAGAIAFHCDAIRRECVCTSDAMCANHPDGKYCNAFTGRCVADVAGCKSDQECGNGRYCDQSRRTCGELKGFCEACTTDQECGAEGQRCVALPGSISPTTYCLAACDSGGACPDGRTCSSTEKGNLCVPATGGCRGTAGACIPDEGIPCTSSDQCNAGQHQVCDRTLRRCIVDPESVTCPADQSCDPVTRACDLKCRTDNDCQTRKGETGWICINSACVRATTCQADADCPANNLFCFKSDPNSSVPGECRQTCNAPEDCPLGQTCVNDDLTARRRCVPGCRGNQDCPVNAVCENNQCAFGTPPNTRCQMKEACPFGFACVAGTCQKQAQNCAPATNGCAGGVSVTLYHSPGCGAPSPTCQPMTCSTDANDRAVFGCGSTRVCFCSMQRCLVRCNNDGQCPNGFSCDDVFTPGNTVCVPNALAAGDPCRNFP